jgi:hypothetical protein
METFSMHYSSRSWLGVVYAALTTGLAIAFIAARDSFFPVFLLGGFILAVAAAFLWWFVWKKREWSLQICAEVLTWRSSGQKSPVSGRIPIAEIARLVVDDAHCELVVVSKVGAEHRIYLPLSGYSLVQHLASHYPQLALDYRPLDPSFA